MWHVYILEGKDKSLYTGVTSDVTRRISEHSTLHGSHSIEAKLPITLLYQESHSTRTSAFKREAQIKQWSRAKKLALIAGDLDLLKKLSKSTST